MSRDTLSFGEYLRRLRTSAALSQEDLAERAGLSPRGISDLERGVRRSPHLATVRLLADALTLSPAERRALLAAARPENLPDSRHARDAGPAPLPAPLTPLVGRKRELAAIASQLRNADVRLVTLTGAGGIGKTRLALTVAQRTAPYFPDGVAFVSLAPLGDPGFVASAIAQRLSVREAARQPLSERLKAWLGDKRLLLVLDNFEHLLPAAPLVADLLATCPSLKTLVTSRAPLHLSGEHVYLVPPLVLPDSRRISPLDELGHTEAVRLFVDRGHAAKPEFALTAANAPAVAEIVRRLDGLPLAIELAAAWIPILSPAALLARLDRRLPLLTGGAQDLPVRQRTLRDTIAWSYDLLPRNGQTFFRRLAIFVGGWTLEAAEAVCEVTGDRGSDVLDGLAALVDHNLISEQGVGDEPRFGMLETIREFGLEQLHGSGEEVRVRDAHAKHFLARVGAYRYLIEGPQRPTAQAQMRRDLDNIRAALAWAIQRQDAITAQGIAGGLGPFWMDHGLIQEGQDWIDTSLGLPVAAVQVAQGAQYWGGHFALWQGDVERAEALGRDALARARSSAEEGGGALAAGERGWRAW